MLLMLASCGAPEVDEVETPRIEVKTDPSVAPTTVVHQGVRFTLAPAPHRPGL